MSETPDGDPPTVAVTGAAGFVGSRLLAELQDRHPDWELRGIDNFYLGDVREVGDVAVEHVDVRNRDRLESALEGADVVMHLAAISGVDDAERKRDLAYEVNVEGTNNVAWCCRKHGIAMGFPFSMAVLGDPERFPITVDHPRGPMNWYGRSKLLGERAVEAFAGGDDGFPAHCYLVSNLYGEHRVGDRRVSKGTVINFFVGRAREGDPLTVYEPGTQARNLVHVADVADAFAASAERLLEARRAGRTGAEKFEVASDEDPSVSTLAELVREAARDLRGIDVEVRLVENPRDETLVDSFAVDTSRTRSELDWEPTRSVEETVRELLAE